MLAEAELRRRGIFDHVKEQTESTATDRTDPDRGDRGIPGPDNRLPGSEVDERRDAQADLQPDLEAAPQPDPLPQARGDEQQERDPVGAGPQRRDSQREPAAGSAADDSRQATGDSRRDSQQLAADGADTERRLQTRAELDQAVIRAREALARIGAEAREQADRRTHEDAGRERTRPTQAVREGQVVQGTQGAGVPRTGPTAPPPAPPPVPAAPRRAPGHGR
jgi:hypothetical protein